MNRSVPKGNSLFSSAKSAVSVCGFHSENALFSEPFRWLKKMKQEEGDFMSSFEAILQNTPLWAAIIGWAAAQGIKIILTLIMEKRFDASRIMGTGGMPSSHSSFTMALSFSIAKYHGFDSPLFAVALIFSFVTMYDAQGIRRAAGRHAEILNDLILEHKMPDVGELKELLGHTPLEVAAGALLGIGIGLWL